MDNAPVPVEEDKRVSPVTSPQTDRHGFLLTSEDINVGSTEPLPANVTAKVVSRERKWRHMIKVQMSPCVGGLCHWEADILSRNGHVGQVGVAARSRPAVKRVSQIPSEEKLGDIYVAPNRCKKPKGMQTALATVFLSS